MKVGNFEISVVSVDKGTPFPEVFDPPSGRTYVVARHEQPYRVRVSADVFGEQSPIFPYLWVDHKIVHETYQLTQRNPCGWFKGFLLTDDDGFEYELFQFQLAEVDMNTEAGPSTVFRQGVMQVRFYAGILGDKTKKKTGALTRRPPQSPEKVPKMPVDRKNRKMPPSLVTGSAGRIKKTLSRTKYVSELGSELGSLVLYYATSSALLFHQILKRDDPAHAVILDMFEETRYVPPPPVGRRLLGTVNLVNDDAEEEKEECIDLTDDLSDAD